MANKPPQKRQRTRQRDQVRKDKICVWLDMTELQEAVWKDRGEFKVIRQPTLVSTMHNGNSHLMWHSYSSDLDFSSVSFRLRPRFFNVKTISSSFLGRGGILFSVSLTGVRLSLRRRSGVTVSFFWRKSSFDLDRVCFEKEKKSIVY
jgi:hypothetical protein